MATPYPLQSPVGLNQLIPLDKLVVRQKFRMSYGNMYVVETSSGQEILRAKQEMNVSSFLYSGDKRPFHINIVDMNDQDVMVVHRSPGLCSDKVTVSVRGARVSVVRRAPTLLKPVLTIGSAADQPVLRVKGSAVTGGDCVFDLQTPDKRSVGSIHKKWGGLFKELCSNTDSFDVRVPRDLHVHYKAAVIGTCLFIDYLFYDK